MGLVALTSYATVFPTQEETMETISESLQSPISPTTPISPCNDMLASVDVQAVLTSADRAIFELDPDIISHLHDIPDTMWAH